MREFSDKAVPPVVLERILNAGLQAPSHNHMREWEFVVLQEQKDKENALRHVEAWAKVQGENKNVSASATPPILSWNWNSTSTLRSKRPITAHGKEKKR